MIWAIVEGPPPTPPASLLARLRAQPARAPEILALAAAERHGPAAASWVAEQRRSDRRSTPEKIAGRARRRHGRLARIEGAATGLGGWVTIIPDMLSVAWIQSRLVFFIAAAYGYDPRDPMRPAELLVLYDLYPDPPAARAALDGSGRSLAFAAVDREMSADQQLAARLAQMAGKEAVQRLAGRAVPGVASIFNAISNESDTKAMADRAIAFYGG